MHGDTKGHYQRGSVDSAPSFNRTQTAQQRASGVCHPLRRAPPAAVGAQLRQAFAPGAARARGIEEPRNPVSARGRSVR